jgi:hypothetical protein
MLHPLPSNSAHVNDLLVAGKHRRRIISLVAHLDTTIGECVLSSKKMSDLITPRIEKHSTFNFKTAPRMTDTWPVPQGGTNSPVVPSCAQSL